MANQVTAAAQVLDLACGVGECIRHLFDVRIEERAAIQPPELKIGTLDSYLTSSNLHRLNHRPRVDDFLSVRHGASGQYQSMSHGLLIFGMIVWLVDGSGHSGGG